MNFIRFLLFLSSFIIYTNSKAQFKSATISINGLTCSMCSNGVEKSLRQLTFVENVEMDLNSTMAFVKFRKNQKVEIIKLAQKVYDAGYSIQALKATFHFDSLQVDNKAIFEYENSQYQFISISKTVLTGEKELHFLGKKYLSKKDFHKWESAILNPSKNLYYITL